MNIDKFGHHIHKRMRFSELLDFTDKALLKSETGEYDLKLLRLKGVKTPLAADDVVNKEYVDKIIHDFYNKNKKENQNMVNSLKSEILKLLDQYELKSITSARKINKLL